MNREMFKNIVICGLILVVAAETGLLLFRKFQASDERREMAAIVKVSPSTDQPRPASPSARLPILSKGDKLSDSPIFKFAYQVFPGDLSTDTQKALVGFAVSKEVQKDGTTLVKFTPKDSDDQSSQYIVRTGETLYFIEQTPVDDKADEDKDINLRDDYGVIVDANGIVQ